MALAGRSYSIKDQDTIVFETYKLVQEQDSLFHIPIVKNENNNLPVRFVLKFFSDTQLLFQNPTHDFPQVITYTKINSDSLVAEISGTQNDKREDNHFR
jgi:hypothetical protein